MLVPCESIIKRFLPAIRAGITKELATKYGFTQMDIASKLGITQAAVSKYLSGDYSRGIKRLEKNKEVKKTAEEIARKIANKEIKKSQIKGSVCESCVHFRKDGLLCGL